MRSSPHLTEHEPAPYRPEYDPAAWESERPHPSEAVTDVFPAIPAQPTEYLDEPARPAAAPRYDDRADDRVDGWADDYAPAHPDRFDDRFDAETGYASPDGYDAETRYDSPDEYTDDLYDDDEYDEPEYDQPGDAPAPRRGSLAALLVPTVVGIAVAVGLGVYSRLHTPTGAALNLAGFSSGLAAKTWLTTAAFVLVLVQLWSSMRMYGRLSRTKPAGPRIATVHRWSGRVAVLLTIPVAVHCLYALGFEGSSPRVLAHSLLGCLFYGAFAAKMLVLPRRDAPRWAVPVAGGLLFTLLTGLFLTSAVWFFSTRGLTF